MRQRGGEGRAWFALVLSLAAIAAVGAPEPAVAKPPASTTSTDATFRFASNDKRASFTCSLDGAGFAPCSPPKRYTGLELGAHRFRVRAHDPAGNVDPTPATHRWRVEAPHCTPEASTRGKAGSLARLLSKGSGGQGDRLRLSSPILPPPCAVELATLDERPSEGAAGRIKRILDPPEVPTADAPDVRLGEEDDESDPEQRPDPKTEAPPACPDTTVAADRDAWVLESSPLANHGIDSALRVGPENGAGARALLGFTLPAVPSGCQVKAAALRLYSKSPGEARVLEAVRLAGSWNEAVVSWIDQPAPKGAAATAPSRSSPGHVEWSVTAQVLDMYSGTSHGFMVRDSAEDGAGLQQSFSSREEVAHDPPQLRITYGP